MLSCIMYICMARKRMPRVSASCQPPVSMEILFDKREQHLITVIKGEDSVYWYWGLNVHSYLFDGISTMGRHTNISFIFSTMDFTLNVLHYEMQRLSAMHRLERIKAPVLCSSPLVGSDKLFHCNEFGREVCVFPTYVRRSAVCPLVL